MILPAVSFLRLPAAGFDLPAGLALAAGCDLAVRVLAIRGPFQTKDVVRRLRGQYDDYGVGRHVVPDAGRQGVSGNGPPYD